MELTAQDLDIVRAVVAHKFRYSRHFDRAELIQIGLLGLAKAVASKTQKPELAQFKTYASHCIKNEIIDAVRKAEAKKRIQPEKLVRLSTIISDSNKVVNGEVIDFDY